MSKKSAYARWTILQWAADERRLLISRDIKTIPTFAHARVVAGQIMPGVFILRWTISMSEAIDDIALVADVSGADEWADHVIYLPLR